MKHIYTSVDIGSDSIKIVVCELFRNKLNLLAASSVKSEGIKKGLITNVTAASTSLRQGFQEIEQMLGIQIRKVVASVPSYFAEFSRIEGSLPLTLEEGCITGEDVVKVLQKAMMSKMTQSKEMVTILPVDFTVDDQTGIKDPKGLVGSILSARAVMVTTPKKNIYSVVSLLENIGVEVVDISLNSIGDLYAFKNKDIDEKVGAIIDIGSEATSVSLYNKGVIVKNSILPYGGKNIDQDLAYIYKIDLKNAAKLKEKFALAHKRYAGVNDLYEMETVSGETISIVQFEASEIVMSRLEEILTLAKKEINVLTNKEIEYIIITGGTSNMAHFNYIAEEVFGKSVVIGNVKMIGIRNNKYSAAIGNLVYFIHKLKIKGKEYSMFSKMDMEELSNVKKSAIHISNESMLGKVFGYFFNE